MRRFLYISPTFPPQTQVGALRPLKFARHIPDFGWAPVVLADLHASDGMDRALDAAIPESATVIRDYSAAARPAEREFREGRLPRGEFDAGGKPRGSSFPRSVIPRLLRNEYRSRSFWFPSPEWLPLGHHGPDTPHAIRAARAALDRNPDCEAIVVNADPWAALLVGRIVSAERGIPLICDLRDPWSVCELRRHRRPLPQRYANDWLERWVFRGAARIIVNTETALADYRAFYPDLPADRFLCIRNHGDAALIREGRFDVEPVFTMLFLGNFRRFVEGDILLRALGVLHSRGYTERDIRLVVTGKVMETTRAMARTLGVSPMFVERPFVPIRQTGTYMEPADLLISLGNRTRQRIPAKIYEYLTTTRPILSIADSAELRALLSAVPGAHAVQLDDLEGAVGAMEAALRAGRHRSFSRDALGFDSNTAARRLAEVLDAATASGRRSAA